MNTVKFGMKPIPERTRQQAYMKSLFALKPIQAVAKPEKEKEKEEPVVQTYIYLLKSFYEY